MKKIFSIFMMAMLLLVSCSKNDDSNDNSNDDVYIKFTVNGQNYNYNPATGISLKTTFNGGEGVDNTYKFINLSLPNDYATGTYDIVLSDPNDLTTYNAYYESVGDNIDFEADSGTITITSIGSEYVTGTFNFSGDNNGTTVSVTNGSFRALR